MKKINSKKGFSLVELLVVISIIATLTAIILPNLMGAREKARDSQRIQDLNSLKTALRMYYNDNQVYPTPVSTGNTLAASFSTYFPAISNIGFTYSYYYKDASGDSFITCVNLESGAGTENTLSQMKCGVPGLSFDICGLSAGTTSPKVYTVCAN